jgi:hypothetical protein
MQATLTPATFDGRDVSDLAVPDDVFGYELRRCPACDTERDPRYPHCCEFAADAARPVLVAAH